MRHPELIFLHSANADGFDVRPVTFKSCVRRQSAEPRRNGRCRLSRCEERDEPYGHVIEEIGVGQPGASQRASSSPFCSGADPRIAIPASGMVNAAQQGLTHERCRSQLSRSRKTPCIFGGIHTWMPIGGPYLTPIPPPPATVFCSLIQLRPRRVWRQP